MIQMIDSVVELKKERNKIRRCVKEPRMVSNSVWLCFESSLEQMERPVVS